MTKDQREIQRKLRILRYAEEIGHVAKTCRYFGIGRASFYRWRKAYAERGEAGLINAPPVPKWHANRTPPEREEKVLYLRRKYHLGPMRIVWYLARYQVLPHFVWSGGNIRALSNSGPALPYIARLRVLSRLIWPSACPLLPGQINGVVDGIDVSAHDTCEPHDRNELSLDRIVNPRIQWCGTLTTKNTVETHRQASHLGESVRSLLQGIDLPCLPVCQQASRLDAQRCGDHWRDRMAGFRVYNRLQIQCSCWYNIGLLHFGPPTRSQQALQIGAASGVAALPDVMKQVSSAAVPILPALSKERLEIPW